MLGTVRSMAGSGRYDDPSTPRTQYESDDVIRANQNDEGLYR